MKKLIVLSLVIVSGLFILTGCNSGNATNASNSCAAMEIENDSLKNVIRNQPTEAQMRAKVENEITTEAAKVRQQPYFKHLDTLDYSALPGFAIAKPTFSGDAIEDLQQNMYSFERIPYDLATVIGVQKNVLKGMLENEYILSALFKANKAVAPQVLEGLGLHHVSKNWAIQLLPYFEGTSPNIKHFDVYFKGMEVWEHSEEGVNVVKPDFVELMSATGLTDNELSKQYNLYRFAKRRMMSGLKEECTEILKFIANLPAA